ncbi:hypothetical protein WJX75_002418 [Coccomyxa subellipsoidea]|uniref:Uncharacterized protein n=1 Tax=Coccomyxa subellipsoidea TaxID=248742 RepID=A0ABR2YAH8_9CHLO
MIPKQRDTQEDRAKPAGPPLQNLSIESRSKVSLESFKEILSNPCQSTPDTPVGWSRHFNLSSSERSKVFCELLTQAAFKYCSCAAADAAERMAAGSRLVSTILCMSAHMVPVWLLKATRSFLKSFQWARDAADRLAFADILASNEIFSALMEETYQLLDLNPADTTTLEDYLQEYYTS